MTHADAHLRILMRYRRGQQRSVNAAGRPHVWAANVHTELDSSGRGVSPGSGDTTTAQIA